MNSPLPQLRYTLRSLRKRPGFTVAVVMTLALGIGATLAVFTVLNAVLLRPLPYAHPEQLVTVGHHNTRSGEDEPWVSWETLAGLSGAVPEVETAAGVSPEWDLTVNGGGGPVHLQGYWVSASFLPMLGVRPALGRNFTMEEDRPAGQPAVILSHRLWLEHFGGSRDILGRTIRIGSAPTVIVGVLPKSFRFESDVDLWLPLGQNPLVSRGRQVRWVQGFARLEAGATLAGARTSIQTYMRRLAATYPKANAGLDAHVETLYDATVGGVRRTLWVLQAAVVLVLLIAIVNIGNLLLARAAAREGELIVRNALGASRLRLVRELLTESLALGVLGGGLGVGLGWVLLQAFRAVGPTDMPRFQEVQLSPGSLGALVLVSLIAALAAGLVPVAALLRGDLSLSLQTANRRTTGSRGKLRDLLVTAELALALLLLVGAGLLLRSYAALTQVDPGFRARGVLTLQMGFAGQRDDAARMALYQRLWSRLEALPAVDAAGGVTRLPLGGQLTTRLEIADHPQPAGDQPEVEFRRATSGYFKAMGVRRKAGRLFDARDDAPDAPGVAVVDSALARKFWPESEAIGKRVRFWYAGMPEDAPWLTVVGVVADVKQFGLDAAAPPMMYVPFGAGPPSSPYVVLHANTDARSLVDPVTRLMRELDPDVLVWDVQPMSARLDASFANRRFSMLLLGLFAALAVMLGAIGIFGVTAFSVRRRIGEIGIRMALGASRAEVLRAEMLRGLRLAGFGLGAGLIAAWVLTRTMRSMLFGVGPTDPLAFASVSLLFLIVALAASYLPARRAAAVHPMRALREE